MSFFLWTIKIISTESDFETVHCLLIPLKILEQYGKGKMNQVAHYRKALVADEVLHDASWNFLKLTQPPLKTVSARDLVVNKGCQWLGYL